MRRDGLNPSQSRPAGKTHQEIKIRFKYILPSLPETDSFSLQRAQHENPSRNNNQIPRRDGLNPSLFRPAGNKIPEFIIIAIIYLRRIQSLYNASDRKKSGKN